MALNGVAWTNGVVSLTSDLIFGVSVLAETGWMPISQLDKDDLAYVRKLVDHNTSCPFLEDLAVAAVKLTIVPVEA
jgi:hypothetical protein